jgi:hypothetical protein
MWDSLIRSFLKGALAGARGSKPAYRRRETDRGRHRWTTSEVLAAMGEDPVALAVVHRLLAWAADRRLRVSGTTTKAPALAWHLDALETDYTFFLADARRAHTRESVLWLYFQYLKSKPILDAASRRAALVAALSTHFEIPPDRVDKQPSIPLAALADEQAFQAFTSAWDAVIDDIRRAETESRPQPVVHSRLYAVGIGALLVGRLLWSRRRSARRRARRAKVRRSAKRR